jgi:hypothetical protein
MAPPSPIAVQAAALLHPYVFLRLNILIIFSCSWRDNICNFGIFGNIYYGMQIYKKHAHLDVIRYE